MSTAYHHVLDVLLHQVALGGYQYGATKGVQVSVVQLVRVTVHRVRCVHMDISRTAKKAAATGIKHS